MSKPSDFIQGTLDLLILKALANGPRHGWAIGRRIQEVSGDVLQITQGSLYPALHRLEQQGWLKARWITTETGREAKAYQLNMAGRKTREGARQLGPAVRGDSPGRARGLIDGSPIRQAADATAIAVPIEPRRP